MPDDLQNNPLETAQEPLAPPFESGPLPVAGNEPPVKLGAPAAEEQKIPTPEPQVLPVPSRVEELAPHDPGVHLSSKKRLFYIGTAIAILNPLFSGLVFGLFLWKEPGMRREGKIITVLSIGWGVIALALAYALRGYQQ